MVKPTTTAGYMFGLRRNDIPSEPGLDTNEALLARGFDPGVESFADIRSPGPRSRMAGDVLPLDLLEPGEQPVPYTTGSILRQGLRGTPPSPPNLQNFTR